MIKTLDEKKHQNLNKKIQYIADAAEVGLFFIFTIGLSAIATASIVSTSDPFFDFMDTVEGWAQGPLGIGLAVTSIIIGGARAVGNNNPFSALAGVALGAFIAWGPSVVKGLISGGAVII